MSDGGGHATHLAIASLDELEADPAIGDAEAMADGRHARRDIRLGLQPPCPARAGTNPLYRDPCGETCQGVRPGHAFHLRPIDAGMGGGGIEQAAVQAGFVGQEKESLGIRVEATERIDAGRQPKAGQRPVGRPVGGELAQDSIRLVEGDEQGGEGEAVVGAMASRKPRSPEGTAHDGAGPDFVRLNGRGMPIPWPMHEDAMQHLARRDRVMGRLIRKAGPCLLRPEPRRSPFQSLVGAVAHQQLNGTAAATILRRFTALFPGRRFPRPEDVLAMDDEALRGAGLSRAKVAAIRDIAARVVSGEIPTARAMGRMPDDEVVGRLTAARGVGRWTVEMLLMFQLGRPDVLPCDDFGVRNGFRIAYGLGEMPRPRELMEFGERWRPHRTVASWYLWRAVDMERAGASAS